MGGLLLRILATLLGVVCLVSAIGGLMALATPRPPLRGEMVDIGGRRLRLVCAGPGSDKPLVVLESGIFGFASDWGEVQKALAARGVRSCAYDRAGLAYSDPGPDPRDGLAIVRDLEVLLRVKGETGPLILVGHSMAGLHARLFALRNPDRVRGLLLVDATSPSTSGTPTGRKYLTAFNGVARLTEVAAALGLMKPVAPFAADMIGLDRPAHAEKVWFWAYRPSIRAGAAETYQSLAAAKQAAAAGALNPDLPVGAVTEGRPSRHGAWADARLEGAQGSRHGFSVNIPDATHASMLGRAHAGVIADAVVRVMGAASRQGKKPPPKIGGG
jgi:pimeloyl-ACP methyl ester carboxylesterase